MKRSLLSTPLVIFLLLIAVIPALAAYLGPDRTRTETRTTCQVTLYVCAQVNGNWKYKIEQTSSCGENKWWLAYPSNAQTCNAANSGYEYYEKGDVETTVSVTYPPATVSETLMGCTLKNGWCGVTQPSLVIDGVEPVSGYSISAIEGQRNGTNFHQNGSSTAFTLNEGQNDFSFWAVSTWGDTSLMKTRSAKVDLTPPNASLTISGTMGLNGWYVSAAQVSGSASDSLSGLDSVAVAPGGTDNWQSSLNLSDGVNVVRLSAFDVAGNRFLDNFTVRVDSVPPVLSTLLSGAVGQNGWYVSPITLSANTSDATSGVASAKVSVDGGPWANVPFALEGDGQHTAVYRVLDAAGNQTEASLTVRLDTAAPQASLTFDGTLGLNNWYVSPVKIDAGASDALSGLDSLLLTANDAPVANSVTVGDGTYHLKLTARDKAGNMNVKIADLQVDAAPPALTSMVDGAAGQNGWYVAPVALSASASDALSGLALTQVSLDNGATWNVLPYALSGDGEYAALYRASDLAGNTSTDSKTVRVDQTPPDISFPMDGSIVSGAVSLLGLASDALSGLDSVRVSFDGGSTWADAQLDHSWWRYEWDASALQNGAYSVLASARDRAGNVTTRQYSLTVSNEAPSLSVEGWIAPGQGSVRVEPRGFAVASVRVVVRDPAREAEQEIYNGTASGPLTWGGAEPGEYPLVATACDVYGRCAEARGVVIVPTPDATAVPSPAVSASMLDPVSTPAAPPPSVPAPIREPASDPTPVFAASPESTATVAAVKLGFLDFLPIIFFALLCIIAAAALLLDPRPRALRRLSAAARSGMEKKQ